MHLGFDRNEYGTQISKHRCDVCGREFTLCPASAKDDTCGLPPTVDGVPVEGGACASYDPRRDVDLMLADGAALTVAPPKPEVS